MNKEDQEILPTTHTEIGYILTLGVNKEYRRNGIASLLLDNYLSHLNTYEAGRVQAVLLHVLISNDSAITFYEQRNFVRHSFLPYYYNIKGKPKDGLSYVRYINGGHPPWNVIDQIYEMTSPHYLSTLFWWPLNAMSKFFYQIARSATAFLALKST